MVIWVKTFREGVHPNMCQIETIQLAILVKQDLGQKSKVFSSLGNYNCQISRDSVRKGSERQTTKIEKLEGVGWNHHGLRRRWPHL